MLRRSMITGGLAGLLAALVTSTSAAAQRFAHPSRQRLYRVGSPIRMKGVEKPFNPIAEIDTVVVRKNRDVQYMVTRKADQFVDARRADELEPCEGTQYAEYNEVS